MRQNSIESLGSGYVNDFFQGALLLDKTSNRILKIAASDGVNISCYAASLDTDPLLAHWGRMVGVNMKELGIETFSAFSWPKMGYRNTPCNYLGNSVWFLQTTRGTGRGLRDDSISREQLSIFQTIFNSIPGAWDSSNFQRNGTARALAVYNPKWYSFKEGMSKLRDGEWLGFALNEDLAITIAHQSSQTMGYDVFFRGNHAGSISEEGHLMMKNKALSRTALLKFLNEEAIS